MASSEVAWRGVAWHIMLSTVQAGHQTGSLPKSMWATSCWAAAGPTRSLRCHSQVCDVPVAVAGDVVPQAGVYGVVRVPASPAIHPQGDMLVHGVAQLEHDGHCEQGRAGCKVGMASTTETAAVLKMQGHVRSESMHCRPLPLTLVASCRGGGD